MKTVFPTISVTSLEFRRIRDFRQKSTWSSPRLFFYREHFAISPTPLMTRLAHAYLQTTIVVCDKNVTFRSVIKRILFVEMDNILSRFVGRRNIISVRRVSIIIIIILITNDEVYIEEKTRYAIIEKYYSQIVFFFF